MLCYYEFVKDMIIRKIEKDEAIPWPLLELADPSLEKVKAYVESGDLYVALINNHIVGEYVLMLTSEKAAEIMNVAVDPAWQGKGIGKRLVLDAIERAKDKGVVRVEIGTGNSSIGQIELYKKCGFTITGIEKGFFLKNYPDPIYENGVRCEDMVRMALTL